MAVNVIASTLETLKLMSVADRENLKKQMEFDGLLFTEICFPDIITKYLTEEEKYSFLNGSLDRSEYVPIHHYEYYQVWDRIFKRELNYAMLVFFRTAAKTTIKRISLTRNICYGHRIVIPLIGCTAEKSNADIHAVQRYIEHNRIIRFLFGNLRGAIWNVRGAEFYSPEGSRIKMTSHGIFSEIRGVLEVDDRPDLVPLDEFETEKACEYEEQRIKISNVLYHEVFRMGEGNDRTAFMLTNTIPHPESFTAKARTNPMFQPPLGIYREYPVSFSPSITKHENGSVTISEHFDIGEPIWGRAYGHDYLMREYNKYKNNNDMVGFYQELYNIPKQETKSKFDTTQIKELDCRYIVAGDISYIEITIDNEVKRVNAYAFTGHDPASGRSNPENDNTSMVTLLKTPVMTETGKEYHYVLVNIFDGKVEVEEQRDMLFRNFDEYKPKESKLETFNMAYGIYTMCLNKKKKIRSKINLTRWEVTTTTKDDKFVDYLIPLVNHGKISYIKGCKKVDVLKDQLKLSRSKKRKDDIVDALFLAIIASERYDVPIENIGLLLMTRIKKRNPLFEEPKKVLNYMEI